MEMEKRGEQSIQHLNSNFIPKLVIQRKNGIKIYTKDEYFIIIYIPCAKNEYSVSIDNEERR